MDVELLASCLAILSSENPLGMDLINIVTLAAKAKVRSYISALEVPAPILVRLCCSVDLLKNIQNQKFNIKHLNALPASWGRGWLQPQGVHRGAGGGLVAS